MARYPLPLALQEATRREVQEGVQQYRKHLALGRRRSTHEREEQMKPVYVVLCCRSWVLRSSSAWAALSPVFMGYGIPVRRQVRSSVQVPSHTRHPGALVPRNAALSQRGPVRR